MPHPQQVGPRRIRRRYDRKLRRPVSDNLLGYIPVSILGVACLNQLLSNTSLTIVAILACENGF